jgi:hypothetical protein
MAEYYAWDVTGVVTGLESWSEPDYDRDPHSAIDGTGAVQIASRIIERQTFGIRQRDGRELEVSLADSGLLLRNGHIVTAVWVARRGLRHGFCALIDNHTTGAQTRLPQNIKLIRPKISLARTAKFGLLATVPAAITLMMWLLIPGSLQSVDLNVFFIGATIALIVLFIVGLVVSKLVLDYLQADDDQKIWDAAEQISAETRAEISQRLRSHPRK